MPEEVLGGRSLTAFRYWVQEQYEQELQAIWHQYLLWIFVDHMIVRYAPSSRIEIQSLIEGSALLKKPGLRTNSI